MSMFFRTHALYALQLSLGLILIYLSVFLREDEEGALQNRAEEWWIRIVNRRNTVHEKISSFVQGVASLTTRIFDWLFGKKLVSFRVLGMSLLLTPASAFLFLTIFILFHFHTQRQNLSGPLRLFVFFFLWALIPAISDSKVLLTGWWISIIVAPLRAIGFILFLAKRAGWIYVEHSFLYLSSVFALSLICDLIYLAATRRMLLKLSIGLTFFRSLYLMLGHLLLLTVLLVAPIFIGLHLITHSLYFGGAFISAFAFNTLNLVVSSVGFIVALCLLLHHLVWPAIERPIYAFQRFSPITKHRKKVLIIGCALALFPANSIWSTLKLFAARI